MTLEELRYFFNRITTLFPLKNTGAFIPISKCQPIFEEKRKEVFDINKENFF